MTNAQQTGRLKDLIVRCRDDSRLYRQTASDHGAYRDELMALARQRSSFAEALTTIVRKAGASPSHYGSAAAWLRRTLFEVRVAVLGTGHAGDSLLACADQEARTVKSYVRALKGSWPAEEELLLRAQLTGVEGAFERVRFLRGQA